MATETKGLDLSLRAAADLSAKQHTIMKVSEENGVTFGTAGTDKNVGILQNKPGDDHAASVRVSGISKMIAGAALASVGLHITADSAGRGVGTTTDGHICIGYNLEICDAADEVVTVLVLPHVVFVA